MAPLKRPPNLGVASPSTFTTVYATCWWLNQPIWKNRHVKLDHFPQIGMNIKNVWKHDLVCHVFFFQFQKVWLVISILFKGKTPSLGWETKVIFDFQVPKYGSCCGGGGRKCNKYCVQTYLDIYIYTHMFVSNIVIDTNVDGSFLWNGFLCILIPRLAL